MGALAVGLAAHSLACWGENAGFTPNCQAAVIDGFTLPISYFGGKAFEPLGEALGQPAKGAFNGLCDWAGDRIAEWEKRQTTGGAG